MGVRSTVSLTMERDVAVPMRDGVTLYADVLRPAGPGPFPTLLTRTPYDKGGQSSLPMNVRWATAGYAVVIQDVRGRFNSDGAFYAFVNERQDGYDTLDWLAAQPWCNGRIGMFGGSYVGLTQWQAAMSGHSALQAIVPNVTASDYHNGWAWQGGAFELGFNLSWTQSVLAVNSTIRAAGSPHAPEVHALYDAVDAMPESFDQLPLSANEHFSRYARYYNDWLAHPDYDGYWETLDVRTAYERMTVASLNIGGWHDIFQNGTIENFTGMAAANGAERHQLVMGPWNHGGMRSGNPIGNVDFGVRSTGGYIDEGGLHLRWYDRWLRDIDTPDESDAPVRLFTMGRNRWRTAEAWPLPDTDWQEWHLHSDGRANSLNGNGTLTRDAAGDEPADHYVYNPRDPVPSHGGGLCCNNVFTLGGAWDQREIEARPDVLVYTTAPLTEPLEVTGPVRLVLHVASSAVDTDFTAKLVDVGPCGFARNLTDGIQRARYRNDPRTPELLTPNEPVELIIDLWSTSNLFEVGHAIRLEVSSSNFPRFDRNLNTGGSIADGTEMQVALQTVLHSSVHPSRLVLPVVPSPAD